MNPHAEVLLSETLLATRENARTERSVNEVFNYSEFGQRHGGSNKLHTLVYSAIAIAFGTLTVTMIVLFSLGIEGLPVLITVVSILAAAPIFNLVVCAMYLRPRRFLNLLSRCAIWFLIPVGLLTLFFFVVLHI